MQYLPYKLFVKSNDGEFLLRKSIRDDKRYKLGTGHFMPLLCPFLKFQIRYHFIYLGILVRVCTVNLTQSLSERASEMSTHNTLSPSVKSMGTVLVVLPPVGPGPNGTTVFAGTEGSIILLFDRYH